MKNLSNTVNQILCATNLYRDLQGINYFAATKFRDQDVDCLKNNIQYKLKNTITRLLRTSQKIFVVEYKLVYNIDKQ